MFLAPKGTSDIIGMLSDGRFLAVETKKPGEKMTEEQIKFQASVADCGGFAVCVDDLDQLREAMDAL